MPDQHDHERRELKYCERCGSLWLRSAETKKQSAVCPICASRVSPAAWTKRTHKSSRRTQ